LAGSSGGNAYWAFSGGGGGTNTSGYLGDRKYNLSTNETATFTFYGTGFMFHTDNNAGAYVTNGGSFTYVVDGGAPTTFTYSSSGGQTWVTVTGLTRGSHSVVFTPASGKTCFVNGAFAFDGDETAGIHLWENAQFGITSTLAVSRLGFPADKFTAHLITIFLGLNGATGSQYQTDIQTLISNAKTAYGGTSGVSMPSFLLIAPYEQSSSTQTQSKGQARILKAICDADPLNCSFLSLVDRFAGTGLDNFNAGLMNNDYLHPTTNGHFRIAKAIEQALSAAA
jgi:lysophospholipase L1-like esterase